MSESYKQAEKDYMNGMKYKDIAEKYDVSLNTVKSWKQRYGWNRKKGAHKEKSMHTKKDEVASVKKRNATDDNEINVESLQSDDLTDKQRLFCMYYIKYFNATKAYQKAYGCNYISAKSNGHRLLTNAYISAELERMKAEQANGLKLDAQFVLQKYIDIAFADITDFVTFGKKEVPLIGIEGPVINEDGGQVTEEVNYVDFHEASEIDGTIVTEVKKGKDGVSIKLADKMRALDKLAQYFDLFPDKFKQQIEEEKLKLSKDRFELEKTKIIGDEEEHEDDGFLEALQGKVSEVWDDEED